MDIITNRARHELEQRYWVAVEVDDEWRRDGSLDAGGPRCGTCDGDGVVAGAGPVVDGEQLDGLCRFCWGLGFVSPAYLEVCRRVDELAVQLACFEYCYGVTS